MLSDARTQFQGDRIAGRIELGLLRRENELAVTAGAGREIIAAPDSTRQVLGVGQARSRTRRAVERTVPFGLYCYTITVIWYTLHGHHPHDTAEHRARAPWYLTKTHPAFSGMTAKLRRTTIAARFMIDAGQPTDTEIRAVQKAWAAASTDLG
nr:hypothetical protein [Streptomyces spongiicola]